MAVPRRDSNIAKRARGTIELFRLVIALQPLLRPNDGCDGDGGLDHKCVNAIAEQITEFCQTLRRLTVLVLDNASVHTKAVREHLSGWEEQGLFVWMLPTYSPHLNIAEILWKKLKYEWLQVGDYRDKDTLHTAVRRLLNEVGKSLEIVFQPFNKV